MAKLEERASVFVATLVDLLESGMKSRFGSQNGINKRDRSEMESQEEEVPVKRIKLDETMPEPDSLKGPACYDDMRLEENYNGDTEEGLLPDDNQNWYCGFPFSGENQNNKFNYSVSGSTQWTQWDSTEMTMSLTPTKVLSQPLDTPQSDNAFSTFLDE